MACVVHNSIQYFDSIISVCR